MGDLWIGVTGFYATDNPNPGLAVIRALKQADPSWRILALPYDRLGTGAFATELIDAHALVPYPQAGARALLDRFRALVNRHPLHVVIPTVDTELPHYVTLRAALGRLGIQTALPTAWALRAREKRRLPALGRCAGVAVPETLVLRSGEAVRRASTLCRYPQVLKGAQVDSAVVRTDEEFRVAAAELATKWGYPLASQPLIPGEEYDVAAVAHRGQLIGLAVMKKLSVTNKGTAWAGVTVEEPSLVEETRRLVRALRWDGAIEAEFIRTAAGRAYCFEINPRFPSWVGLAAEAGANLPAALLRLVLGEHVEPVRARPGRLFTRAVAERVFTENPLEALDGRGVKSFAYATAPSEPSGLAALPAPPDAGCVAVTGLNAADNPSPGLTVARALRALPTPPRLIGLTHEVLSSGAYVGGVWDEVRVLPFPSREEGGYPEVLMAECQAAGADCLIPTLDIEIPIVAWLAPLLAAARIATLVPPPEVLRTVAKPRLPELAAKGFRLPRTETIREVEQLPDMARTLGMPFLLKGPLADARVVRTEEEARVMAKRLAWSWGFPLIAQEYIEGEEFGVAGVADRTHRLVGAVVVRKEIRTTNGNTWAGIVMEDRKLWALADRFAESVRWVGPFELEIIRHPRRGPFLIEVNPRFPAWIFASAGAGANLPWAAVRLARGERVPPLTPRPGVFYARMAWDATAPVDRMGALAVERRVSGDVT
ncbi:MAG: ATP-grasp domain-containing protein [Candidatus Methylomirabilia bacterium]